MTAITILVLLLAVPVMLIPVVFVWYIIAGGTYAAVKDARGRKVTERKTT